MDTTEALPDVHRVENDETQKYKYVYFKSLIGIYFLSFIFKTLYVFASSLLFSVVNWSEFFRHITEDLIMFYLYIVLFPQLLKSWTFYSLYKMTGNKLKTKYNLSEFWLSLKCFFVILGISLITLAFLSAHGPSVK